MIGELIIAIIMFFLSIMAYIIKTEGIKLSIAGIIGTFGLVWGVIAVSWSNFVLIVITPGFSLLFGSSPITLYNVSALLLFFAWIFVLLVAIVNILLTFNKGGVRIFQNWTKSENDGI